jgi:hypothetical protein
MVSQTKHALVVQIFLKVIEESDDSVSSNDSDGDIFYVEKDYILFSDIYTPTEEEDQPTSQIICFWRLVADNYFPVKLNFTGRNGP